MNKEIGALKLSAWMSLLMGLLGLGFAIWSQSGAIMMDGLFSLINLVASIITIRVARLVRQPPDARLHFGYAQFEPFLNVLKSLSVLVLCGFASASAIDAIVHGGRELQPGPALVYALAAMVGGLIVSGIQRRMARETNSPLLEVEAKSWMIDGLLSGVVALAFAGAILLERGSLARLVPYVDPVLVIALILIVMWVPIGIIRRGLSELLAYAPPDDVQVDVRSRVGRALEGLPVEVWHARMHQVGRYFYLMTQVVLKPEFRLSRVQELDAYRQRIDEAMEGHHPSVITDTIFTEDRSRVE